MAIDNVTNFGEVNVDSTNVYDNLATSIVLDAGQISRLPAASYNVTWWNHTDYPNPTDATIPDPNIEIVRVTAVSSASNTLIVTRAQEGTSASNKNTSGKQYRMAQTFTKKMRDDIETDIANIDHDTLVNFSTTEHYLRSTIDHDALTNFTTTEHYLRSTIDHDVLTNFTTTEHYLRSTIDHDVLTNFSTTEHYLRSTIDHDTLTNFDAAEHFLQSAITTVGTVTNGTWNAAILDREFGGTGINATTITDGQLLIGSTTDFVVATLSTSSTKMSIVNAPNSITLDVNEANIDHDALVNFSTTEHYLRSTIDHDTLVNFTTTEHYLRSTIDHDVLTNFTTTEHFTVASIDHTAISNIGSNAHSVIDTHLTSDGSDHTFLNQSVTTSASPTFSGATLLNSATSELIVTAGTTDIAQISFGDTTDTDIGRIRYDNSNDSLAIFTNGTTQVTIDSTGNVGLDIAEPRARLEILDKSGLASESIQDGNFSSFTNWSEAGDMAEGTTNYVYTHSSGSGSLTQASGDFAIAGIGNRRYKLQYTISNVTETGILAATLTTGFAGTAVTLEVDSGGTKTHYFTSKASPGDFVISVASNTASDTFTIDDVTLKEVTGGDLIVNGVITGGGSEGIKILSDGNVDIVNDLQTGSPTRVTIKGGTNDNGIVFGSLGTATRGIDFSSSGLSGASDYWIYNDSNDNWRTDGRLFVGDRIVATRFDGITDSLMRIVPIGSGDLQLVVSSKSATLMGLNGSIGLWTGDGVSNGTATITDVGGAAHGLSLAAGDLVHIQDSTTSADEGFYHIISDDGTNIVVDRALSGSDTDLRITFYKDVIGFFATDGTNGQRIMNYSHQDKPLQIGGDVLEPTGHSLSSEDVLIGGSLFEVNAESFFDKAISINSNAADTTAIMTLGNTGGAIKVFVSSASPEGVIPGDIGDLCVIDTTAGEIYIKESGSGNTGWGEVGGGVASFSSLWYHGGELTTTIGTVSIFTKITSFENVGLEDAGGNLVGDATTDDDITVNLAGTYSISISCSFRNASGANKNMKIVPKLIFATPKTITDATNTTPIVMTVTAHGFLNGDMVTQSGVGGNAAAIGDFFVSNKTDDTYELETLANVDVAGTGAYTSGGTVDAYYSGEIVIESVVSGTDLERGAAAGRIRLEIGDLVELVVANTSDNNNLVLSQIAMDIGRIE